MSTIKSPKKLIEVALPLEDINAAASREKSIRHGHPSTLHLWWSRKPTAAARAVLFAQMVNDPGGERGWAKGLTKEQAAAKREVLFDIIRDLVKWENTNNEAVLERARAAIRQSWRETCELNKGKPGFDPNVLPAFHDPFAGGGAIPLEAQRLGLESYASDLNPVAVMLNKAMIEIPPKFANSKPVGPIPDGEEPQLLQREWHGAEGLAEDVRRYGCWMREEAKKRIGHLYPEVEITQEMALERPDLAGLVGRKLMVIAWLWARTVKSPNPQFSHVDVPLVSSFVLSKKAGHDAYVQPVIEGDSYRFEVKVGKPPKEAENGTKASGRGADFNCLLSSTPISGKYIKQEGQAHRMDSRLMAIVLDGPKGRIYLPPISEQEEVARRATPTWKPDVSFCPDALGFRVGNYGMLQWSDLFTSRQLLALDTFSDLVQEARNKAIADAVAAGMSDDGIGIAQGGSGATAYGDAVAVYLALAIDKCANLGSSITNWMNDRGAFRETFALQALRMTWEFAEPNIMGNTAGNFLTPLDKVVKAIQFFPVALYGVATQAAAQCQLLSDGKVISTDPPYYDNIGYADLSDFFYVWMRHSLRSIYPELFKTIAVPKAEELIAAVHRQGNYEKAEKFLLMCKIC